MKLVSTRDSSSTADLCTAVMRGLAPDGGLYLPERLPTLTPDFWRRFDTLGMADLAFEVFGELVGSALPQDRLRAIVDGAFTFDAPLVPVAERISVLELFHGPTLAFKDFGARFMARLMEEFRGEQPLTVLVATSGDTGAAVAAGFFGVEGIEVFVLYPRGRVSPLQEKQLTTWGGNITALEVDGTFDDCQRMVKAAFVDPRLRHRRLTSANSINIARLLPQSIYYFRAVQQVGLHRPVAFSVPSGNLGNVCAGVLAHLIGLPGRRFVVAQNANDAFDRFIRTGVIPERQATKTLSNAMDVSIPSNLERLAKLLDGPAMTQLMGSTTLSDDDTLKIMARVHADHGVTVDPHTAVGWHGAEWACRQDPDVHVVVLATAHPAKFPDVVTQAIGTPPGLPERLRAVAQREKVARRIEATDDALAAVLSNAGPG